MDSTVNLTGDNSVSDEVHVCWSGAISEDDSAPQECSFLLWVETAGITAAWINRICL